MYTHTYTALNERSGQTESRSPLCITPLFIVRTNPRYERNPLLLHSLKRLREREALNQNRTTRLSRSPDCFSPKREKQNQRTDEISVYTVSYYGKLQLTVTQTGMAPLRGKIHVCSRVMCACINDSVVALTVDTV